MENETPLQALRRVCSQGEPIKAVETAEEARVYYCGIIEHRDARIAELEGALRTILERSNGYIYNTDHDTGNTFDTDARRVLGEGGAS